MTDRMDQIGTSENLWRVQFNVLYGLVLHDIKTRFFGNGLGQLVMVVWPMVHILILIAIYTVSGRVAPFGSSTILYCATGVMPFIIWSYMSRWMVYTVLQNKAFLNYPAVKLLDIIFARAILEILTGLLVVIVLITTMSCMGIDCWPLDLAQAFYALGAAFLLAFGTGLINAAIASVYNLWVTVYTVAIIIVYASSGIVFVAGYLPQQYWELLSYNPVLQLVEWTRSAYYYDYPGVILDRTYVMEFGIMTTIAGFILEYAFRRAWK